LGQQWLFWLLPEKAKSNLSRLRTIPILLAKINLVFPIDKTCDSPISCIKRICYFKGAIMKAEFTNVPGKDHILLTPESIEETEALLQWNNCVISAEFTQCVTSQGSEPALHICKEV